MPLWLKRLWLLGIMILCSVASSFAATSATVTVRGAEQNINGAWDQGTLSITVNGHTVSFQNGQGQFSTPSSMASGLAALMSEDYNSPASAKAYGPVITVWSRSGGDISVQGSSTASFAATAQSLTSVSVSLSSDTNPARSGQNITFTASVSTGATGSITFLDNGNPISTIALAGNSTTTSTAGLPTGLHSITAYYSGDNTYGPTPSSSLSQLVATPTGPADTTRLYSYSIDSYAPNGIINSYSDSVNGQWGFSYDSLNRLGASTVSASPWGSQASCWQYDSFGNITGHGTVSSGTCYPTATSAIDANNRSMANNSDSAGNATVVYGDNGAVSAALYDAEGRLCATQENIYGIVAMHQYLYDAEGNRAAKGTISSWSCDVTQNGFQASSIYITGPNGQQMTELDGNGNWVHSNAYAGGSLIATYANDGGGGTPGSGAVHFYLADWLGTKRMQFAVNGSIETTWANQPFGDMCTNCSGGTSEQHFTGKERDAESGLDYFGARYYGSSMGRFTSPDWSASATAIPYASLANPQSLNLYAYAGNNPVGRADADGHCAGDGGEGGGGAYGLSGCPPALGAPGICAPGDPFCSKPEGNDAIDREFVATTPENKSLSPEEINERAEEQYNNNVPIIAAQLELTEEQVRSGTSIAVVDGVAVVQGGHVNLTIVPDSPVAKALMDKLGDKYKGGIGSEFARLGTTPSPHLDQIKHEGPGLLHVDRFSAGAWLGTGLVLHFFYDVLYGGLQGNAAMLPY